MKELDFNNLIDLVIICSDCGEEFKMNVNHQKFFLSKGLSIPKRCKPCREKRKALIVPAEEVDDNGQ
jgi:hypothetical protein